MPESIPDFAGKAIPQRGHEISLLRSVGSVILGA